MELFSDHDVFYNGLLGKKYFLNNSDSFYGVIMINFLLFFISITLAQDNQTNAKFVIARSGITLEQCKSLRDQLKWKTDSCDLLAIEAEPYIVRAKKIAMKAKQETNYDASVEKIAQILKEFPETTDEEILKELISPGKKNK